VILCGAARFRFILSNRKIITLDVFCNIHTFLSSRREAAEKGKGSGTPVIAGGKWGSLDRKLVCTAVHSGNVSPLVGVAALTGRSGSLCGRPAMHDPVFEPLRRLGGPAAHSRKNHGILKATRRKWIEKAPA
jgi:hypothetical protein